MHLLVRKNTDNFLEGIYALAGTTSKKGFISKQLKRFVTSAALAASAVGPTPVLAGDNLIFNSDFEGGTTQGWGRQDGELPGAITVQSNTVRAGKYAVKLHMKACSWSDPKCAPKPVNLGRPRAQLHNGKTRFHVGKEYWVAASIFIPNNWVWDSETHDTFLNMHKVNKVDGPGTCEPGYGGIQPFGVIINGKRWYFRHLKSNPQAKKMGDYGRQVDLGPVTKGKWTDFVFNFKFAYGTDGFQKTWINGEQVQNYKGSTICPGKDRSDKASIMPYMNATIYKPGWAKSPNIKQRTAYYDEIRVGNSSASYADVAPGGKQTLEAAPTNPTFGAKTSQK